MSGYQQNMLKCNRKKLSSKVEYVTREAKVITDHLNVMLSKLQQRTNAILKDDDVHFSAHFEEVNEELERALEKVFLVQTTIDSFAQENVTSVNETIDNNIDNFSVNSVNSPDVTFSDQRSPLTDLSNPENLSELNMGLPDISLEPSPALAIVEVPTGKCDHDRIQSAFLQSNILLEDLGNSYCKPSCAASAVGIRETQYSSLECLPAETQVSLNFKSRTVLTSQHSLLQNVSHNYSNENVTEGSDIGNCKKNVAHKKEFVGWNCSDDFVEVYSSRKPNSIPEPDIMLGEQTTASITRFINPSDFWMQIKNFTTKKLCPISISLCSLPDERSSKYLFKKNGFCLAPFNQQGHWYRAKILSSLEPEENDVHLLYIDQGSEGCVPLLQLRPLPKQFYSYPALAIHCFIYGVLPVNGTWSLEAITEFEETYMHSTIEPYIFSKVGDKYPVRFSVTAKVTGKDFTYDMAEMLISFKFGVLENGKEGDFKSIQPSFSVESSNSVVLKENSILDKDNNYVTELLSISENQNHCTVGNIKIKCEDNKSTLHEQLPISKSTLEYNDNLNMKICSEKNERIYSEHYEIEGNTDEVCFLEHDARDESKALEAYESITCSAQQMENNTDFDCKKNVSIVSCLTNDYDWNAVVPVLNFDYTEGDKLIVMMSNVMSPSELYVHCESKNIEDFDDLQDQLSSVYNSCSSSDFVYPNDGLKPNMFCCCCYSVDKNWYRAKILKECNPKEKLVIENSACILFHVQYIDYGNRDIVNIQHIRPLFKKFIEYPAFVICCALAGIKPKSEGAETKKLDYAVNACNYIWSRDAIQKFKMLVTVEKIYTAEVVTSGKYHESHVVPICLWDTDSIKDILINRVLVEQSIAEVLDSSSNFILSENKDCDYFNDPMSEDYYSPLNSYGVNLEDVEIATIGYKAKDEKYICKFFSQFGECHKSDKCSYQHVKVCRGQTQDKKSIDFLGESILLPEISDYLLVSVSAVFNPGHFFVVFPYGNKPVNKLFKSDVYASNYKEAEDLSILMERMREHYNKAFFVDSTTVALACGDLVAAKSKVDRNWCRARVIEIFDVAAPVQVFLVDFGSCELVERTNIRYLELEYRHLPLQAVECHLINVMPPDCSGIFKWNEESRIKFLELVEGKILLAHVTNIISSVVFLELFSTSENKLCNIGKCLIESGCAQHAEIFLGSSCSDQITYSNCGNHVLLPG